MKLFTSVRSISPFLMLFVIVAALQACSGGGSAPAPATDNNAPTTSNVSITDDNGGTILVGDSLTGNYTYTDIESDAEGTSTFRWLRGDTAISGATSLTYTLVVADSDASIAFEVTPIAATGTTTGLAVISSTVVVVNNAPTASNVSITDDNGGTILVGDSLTGNYTYTDIESDAEGTSTFRWLRDGTAISGATAKTYTLVHADSGSSIMFEVIPVASSGTTTGSAATSSGTITIPLAVGGFTKSFGVTDNGGNTYPFHATNDLKVQFLYTSSEINGSGNITKLRFNRGGATAAAISCENMTIKLGQTSLTTLGTTFANNVEQGKGSQVTALNNATVDIPVGAVDEWFDITLSTPFNYNGVDNLVVEVERTTACSDNQQVTVFTAASNIRAHAAAVDVTAGTAEHDQTTAGTTDALQPWMQFVFAGGENKQDFGGATGFTYPFNTAASHSQQLYLASEIDGSGPLTGLALQLNGTSVAGTYTSTITMGHTTLVEPGITFADNFNVDGSTVTANAVTFKIPAGIPAGEWFWIPLPDSTFAYNGTDNLIVDLVITPTAGLSNNLVRIQTGLTRHVLSTDIAAVTGAVSARAVNAMFRFNGGTMNVMTDETGATTSAFSLAATGRINLYRASELGTAASITSVACRLFDAASTASTYDNYQVIIGHSAVDTLSTTAADNFVSQNVAYDGVLDIAAGLVEGDWLTVNLDTPFQYDGSSNLVVWMGTTSSSGAAATHSCYISTINPTRFPGHMGAAVPGAVTNTAQDYKFDMQLGLDR